MPVRRRAAENCTLEPVVLPLVTATLSILTAAGGTSSKEVLEMLCKVHDGKG